MAENPFALKDTLDYVESNLNDAVDLMRGVDLTYI
jgi:hypothetical protein